MRLHNELYFEIHASGLKSDIQKFVNYLLSGELDDFFEFSEDYIIYNDNFDQLNSHDETSVTISNDDEGIEISSFNPENFLDALCCASSRLELHGNLFDIDDEEYYFVSREGSSSYINTEDIEYADELDEEARREENDSDDDYDY